MAEDEIFHNYYDNCVHVDDEYPLSTIANAVVKWSVNGEERIPSLIRRNIPEQKRVVHVVLEEIFSSIEGLALANAQVDVTMYMNYSPCNWDKYTPVDPLEAYAQNIIWPPDGLTCCDALIKFKGRGDIQVTLIVAFVSLYNILRKSCQEELCDYHGDPANIHTSEPNKQGLRNLVANDIVLRTFSPDDWHVLCQELNVNEEDYNELPGHVQMVDRQAEDQRMSADLQAILDDQPVGVPGNAQAGDDLGGNQAGGANQ